MSSSTPEIREADTPDDVDKLRDLLARFWQLDVNESRWMKRELMQKNWTISSLSELYLRDQIDSYRSADGSLNTGQDEHGNIASLASMAISKLNNVLAASANIEADILTTTNSLSISVLRQVIRSGKTPYLILRALLDLPMNLEPDSSVDLGARESEVTFNSIQDIDEAVLLNERYIRSRSSTGILPKRYLVSLKGLVRILGKPQLGASPLWGRHTLGFQRKDPPHGGYEFLDVKRQRRFFILSNSCSYYDTFARITGNILHGLDWKNVLVAGEMALRTLLHVDSYMDDIEETQQGDLDIYIYGLDVEQANEKVEEIYQVWKRNLPATNYQQLVVKNGTTITFIPDYPNRRVQIVLKLFSSPTQVLLHFDVDACAICFDGEEVLMLPRCARAIETGYCVFVMDLIWGHPPSQRRPTRDWRIYGYADRGFGLRILPCYVKSLETMAKQKIEELVSSDASSPKPDVKIRDKDDDDCSLDLPSLPTPRILYHTRDEYRMPQGSEPGLKTLKRVACLGRDYTNRFCWDNTPLHHPIPSSPSRRGWVKDYEARKVLTKERIRSCSYQQFNVQIDPRYELEDMDHCQSKDNTPMLDAWGSISSLEKFMRNVEVWTLDKRMGFKMFDFGKRTSIDKQPLMLYNGETSRANSAYEWDSDFRTTSLVHRLEMENDYAFPDLQKAICEKLQIPFVDSGYSGYLTRRIRQQVYGPDLESVLEKQITIPLVIPHDLEHFLRVELPKICPDLPSQYLLNPFLIPVHDPESQDPANPGIIPSLRDTASEAGNLRYWVITNQSMWTGQHRVMDEVYEILTSLFHWLTRVNPPQQRSDLAQPGAIWYMAKTIGRRAVPPKMSPLPATGRTWWSALTTREAMLFRHWVLAEPLPRNRMIDENDQLRVKRDNFEEGAYLYPVPDELFWNDGDEGEWDGVDVPEWRTAEEEARRKRKREEADGESDRRGR